MVGALLQAFYFARPMMFIYLGASFGALNYFELLTFLFAGLLALAGMFSLIRGDWPRASLLDWVLLAFVVWCCAIAGLYSADSDLKAVVKFILPPLTYCILKRTIRDREEWLTLLGWMLLGFVIPIAASAVRTAMGLGMQQEIYWTGLRRYQGVYFDIHTMGHNMGFLLMLMMLVVVMHRVLRNKELSLGWYVGGGVLATTALYCLWMTQVRTVYFGLMLFFGVSLWVYNRKLLFVATSGLVAIVIAFASFLSVVMYDFVDAASGKGESEMAGSGRPYIWKHNLAIYEELPLDRKIAGVGIGNILTGQGEQFLERTQISMENVWNSHNDFLELLMETGAVGLVLMLIAYALMFRQIMAIAGNEKWVMLAFLLAVVVMNAMSNSYISRVGLGQLFFMIICYVELSSRRALESQTGTSSYLSGQMEQPS